MIARVLVLAFALVGVAWFAVESRSSSAQDRITQLGLAKQPTRASLSEARKLAPRARRWNPDRRVDQALGVLEVRTGARVAGVATLRRAAEGEPANVELWATLAQAAAGTDDALANRANAELRRLNGDSPFR